MQIAFLLMALCLPCPYIVARGTVENEVYTGCGFDSVPEDPRGLRFCNAYGKCFKTRCAPEHVFSPKHCGCVQAFVLEQTITTAPGVATAATSTTTSTPVAATAAAASTTTTTITGSTAAMATATATSPLWTTAMVLTAPLTSPSPTTSTASSSTNVVSPSTIAASLFSSQSSTSQPTSFPSNNNFSQTESIHTQGYINQSEIVSANSSTSDLLSSVGTTTPSLNVTSMTLTSSEMTPKTSEEFSTTVSGNYSAIGDFLVSDASVAMHTPPSVAMHTTPLPTTQAPIMPLWSTEGVATDKTSTVAARNEDFTLPCTAEVNVTGMTSKRTVTGRGSLGNVYIGVRGVASSNGHAHFKGRGFLWIPLYESSTFTSGITIRMDIREDTASQRRQALVNNCGMNIPSSFSIILDPDTRKIEFKAIVMTMDAPYSRRKVLRVSVPFEPGVKKTVEMQCDGQGLVGRVNGRVSGTYVPSSENFVLTARPVPLYIGKACHYERSFNFNGYLLQLVVFQCVRQVQVT